MPYSRAYYQANQEKCRQRSREYYQAHRDVLLARARQRQKTLAAQGLCVVCAAPTKDGKTKCEAHIRQQKECTKALQRKRLEAGLCRRCGAPRGEKSKMYCDPHQKDQARYERISYLKKVARQQEYHKNKS
jgi:hypothetical protein